MEDKLIVLTKQNLTCAAGSRLPCPSSDRHLEGSSGPAALMSSSDSGSEQSDDGQSAFVDSGSAASRNKRKDAPTNDGGGDENEEVAPTKRQRREADVSDGDDSENSTSLSDLDSDGDTPLQELVNNNVQRPRSRFLQKQERVQELCQNTSRTLLTLNCIIRRRRKMMPR
jgi:hypothetical protein